MKLIKDILISLSVIFCLIICVSCKSDNHINKREKTINDIAIAEEIIVKTFDSCSKEDNIKRFRPRGNKEASYEEVLSGETNLSGTFSFYERDVEAFMKVSSEPLSYSFALLEFFIQNGLPETDFSGKCYFDTYSHVIGINDEMSYIKITLLTDDILAIDYGRYHMIIGEDEGISFVFSYCYDSNQLTDYLDKLDFQYFSEKVNLFYKNATLNWKKEIDIAISLLSEIDELPSLPLSLMKEMYLVDGVEIASREHYDENNPNHVVLPTYDTYSLTSMGALQSYFMYEHFGKIYDSFNDRYNIEKDVLKNLYLEPTIMFEIPEEIKIIERLGVFVEDHFLETVFLGLFFYNTDIEFGEDAFEYVTHLDSVFIDSTDRNEDFENSLRDVFPNVKFYYQDEWEIKHDLILPKKEIIIDDSDHKHVFNRQIIDDLYLAQEANCVHGKCYYYVCEYCEAHGNQFYEVGEKGEHNYVVNYQNGDYIGYICTYCGLQYEHNVNDTEHHFVLIETKVPTCEEEGYSLYRCKITGEEKIETYEKLCHTFVNGGICIKCHKEKITFEEHDFEFVYKDEFYICMRCKICGCELLQDKFFTGHTFNNGICSHCTIEEHEHKYGEYFEIDGVSYHCCKVCGYIETKE